VKDGKKVLFIGHDASRTGAPLLLLELIKWLTGNSSVKPSVLLKHGGELEAEYEVATPTRNLVKEFEKINCGFHRDSEDHHCHDALRIWLDPKGSSMLCIEGQRTVNVHDTLTVLKSV